MIKRKKINRYTKHAGKKRNKTRRKIEIVDNLMYYLGIQITNAQPVNRHAKISKHILQKSVGLNNEDKKRLKKLRNPKKQKSDKNKSINIIAEMKHITDQGNQITMTIKNTNKKINLDTGSPVTKKAPDKKYKEKIVVEKKYQDVIKNEVELLGQITVEAEKNN